MDNEETKILNPNMGTEYTEEQDNSQKVAPKADDKKSDAKLFGARMAATAAGAALGTGMAMAADHLTHGAGEPQEAPEVEAKADDGVVEVDVNAGKENAETAATEPTAETQEAAAAAEPAAETHEPAAEVHEAATATVADAAAPQAQYASVQAAPEPVVVTINVNGAQDANVVSAETPAEHQAVMMTDEGIHVAQVDDSASFSEAFADARAQVGAGGVFEWHGKVYNTFTQEEWNNMSQAERAEWQSQVDYDDVIDTAQASVHTATPHHVTEAHVEEAPQAEVAHAEGQEVPENASYIDEAAPEVTASAADDSEVHVIGVAVQDNGQGGMATIAGLQSGDDMAMLIDVDTDGTVDYVVHDDNGDGQITQDEWHDVSSDGMNTAQVVGSYVDAAHQNGEDAIVTDLDTGEHYQITESEDGFGMASMDDSSADMGAQMACNDDMPDYMNDADPGMMDA